MEDFGLSNAKVLCGEYPIYEIMANYEDSEWISSLYNLEGFSNIKINKLLRDLEKNYNLIADLFNTIDYKEIKEEMKNIKTDKFYTFVVTGDLETWKRDEFKGLLMKMGHKLVGSISKKTDYLITNDTNSGTVKNKKAMELGVPIINEEQLKELLGL
jgi:DNA ligase (NAD+)